jgi:catechol 2,3-dioxygenase-like lactoylglutathione lyase family enzyme
VPEITGVLETSLYVKDPAESAEFYRRIFGFDTLFAEERAVGLSVTGRNVLLLFRKRGTLEPHATERGVIPPHDGDGNLHLAFAVPDGSLDDWEARLRDNDVEIESHYEWQRGGKSVYFRDPDGHVIELVTPGCWTIY